MDTKEIRRQNVVRLIDERFDGVQRRFADAAGRDPTVIWQIVNRYRNLGEGLAREIEHNMGLPAGWLDQVHEPGASGVQGETARVIDHPTRVADSEDRKRQTVTTPREAVMANSPAELAGGDPVVAAILTNLALITQDQKRALLAQLSAMVMKNMGAEEAPGEQFPFANGTTP